MNITNTAPYRILLYNIGYGTGLSGTFKEYLFSWHRYVFTSKKILTRVAKDIHALISRIKPDLCCFLEIRQGELHDSLQRQFPSTDSAVKYGPHGFIRKLPIAKRNRNGFLSSHKVQYVRHYLKRGIKKLVYEIQIPDGISLFLVHLSLAARVRSLQLAELAELVRSRPRVILCGDFNISRGLKELEPLCRDTSLVLSRGLSVPTYPSRNPKKQFDLFLHSPDVTVTESRVIQDQYSSDHLPVVLEIIR